MKKVNDAHKGYAFKQLANVDVASFFVAVFALKLP